MSSRKSWLPIVVGAGLVLNGCAGMSRKGQAALIGSAGCGAAGDFKERFYYFAAATYASAFLLPGKNGTPPKAIDPRGRWSMDIY